MSLPDPQSYRQFQAVFDKYYNSLCNYALTFTKSADTSEDIVQELFVKIWEDRRDLLSDDTIRYYLFTATRNNCITWLRGRKNAVILEWNDQDHESMTEPDFSGHRDPEKGTDPALLKQAIDRLPPKCREVFLLSRFSNMSYKEIAASLGISAKTVENQLGKALRMLRTFLKENGVYLVWLLQLFLTLGWG